MWPFDKFKKGGEDRAVENYAQAGDSQRGDGLVFSRAGLEGYGDIFVQGGQVDAKNMLSIPAVWAAVDFLAGTLAALPLRVHMEADHTEIVRGKEANMIGRKPAEGETSFDWRYSMWVNVFTSGRGYTYISRTQSGKLHRLYWDIEPSRVKPVRTDNGRIQYEYQGLNGDKRIWPASQVIDVAWMRANDGLGHVSPLAAHGRTFQQAFNFQRYQDNFAESGGVPPFVLKARWGSQTAIKEGLHDFLTAVRLAKKRRDMVVPIGKDMEVSPLGVTPQQGRIMETQQFIVRQICRIYNLPPIYLHDLDRMTFSNAEHQGLNLTKYTLARWATQFEEQLSTKFLGPGKVARHDMDGLLRGDYATRVQGHSTAIFSGQLTPNEARREEDRTPLDNGDDLFIQSGTVPIKDLGKTEPEPTTEPEPEPDPPEDTDPGEGEDANDDAQD